ncbi:hypothetical protein GLOIN_2v598543 [Rhizophagus irregularis DAOM 181602=DAOM 197198]|nr:hypothetical protein GLOIN_2v598543 [Rhizophagus irregularis DAOM 181602=DAOM 197198]
MDICEVITSIRNKYKINVHVFIMVKDKNRNHKYYWYCEKRDMLNCKGRATTILTKDQLRSRRSQLTGTSQDVHPYLPSRDALRQTVKRI